MHFFVKIRSICRHAAGTWKFPTAVPLGAFMAPSARSTRSLAATLSAPISRCY